MNTERWNPTVMAALFGIPALIFALSASAHAPEEHAKDAEKPDCAAMQGMDHQNMDNDDPVMQAMMEQCKQEMEWMDHHGSTNETPHEQAEDEEAESAPPQHGH